MKELLFLQAYETKKHLWDYCKKLNVTSLPITDNSRDNENFIRSENGQYKYFLDPGDWTKIHNELVTKYLFDRGQELDLTKHQHSIRLTNLRKKVSFHFKELADHIKTNSKYGAPAKIDNAIRVFLEIVNEKDLDHYAHVILYRLQDYITRSLLKNDLDEDLDIDITETTLSKSLALALLNAFFYKFQDYYDVLSMKNTEDVEDVELFFQLLFDKYNNAPIGLKNADLLFLQEELYGTFNIKINELMLVDFFCRKTLLFLLRNVVNNRTDLRYIGIQNYLDNAGVDDQKIYVMEKLLDFSITEKYVQLGSIIVNKLCQANIIETFIVTTFTKNPHDKVQNKIPQTTLKVKIVDDIVYDLYLNSGGFKPFLHIHNLHDKQRSLDVYTDQAIVNLKLDLQDQKIRSNHRGKGTINPSSFLKEHPHSSDLHLSIDLDFLNNYLDLIEQIANKSVDVFNTSEEKEKLYSFLSLYQAHFENIQQSINEQEKKIFDEILNYSLMITEKSDVIIIRVLRDKIKNDIKRSSVQEQLNQLLHVIQSYKTILILALSDYIVYSIFNFAILPSFFDFRGRRYVLGLTFNFQSYPFLKAFVKLFEMNIKHIDQRKFTFLRETFVEQIDDQDLKTKINDKMTDYTSYQQLISEKTFEFIFSHIDQNQMKKAAFKDIYYSEKMEFLPLYSKIIRCIKKKSRALVITSYILLEQALHSNITNANYVNNYSYDMVMSGYEMVALLFPTKEFGVLANLIGTEFTDIYMDLATRFNKRVEKVIKLFDIFATELYEFETPIDDATIQESKNLWENYLKHFHFTITTYEFILNDISKNKNILDNIVLMQEYILKEDWVLTPKDFEYIKKHSIKKITDKCLLILGRIYSLKEMKLRNHWIDLFNIFGNRGLFKRLIMIELYGGTRSGRKKAFMDFLNEMLLELGVRFHYKQEPHILFFFIENFYEIYRRERLSGTQHLTSIAKFLAKQNKIITIKTPYFISQLAPTKFIKDKRTQIKTLRIGVKRNAYQLTLNKPSFKMYTTLSGSEIIINTNKLISLFPPNFIHSMDSMCPQMGLELLHVINEKLKPFHLRINFPTVHDNFGLGRTLYPIVPEMLIHLMRKLFRYGYLNTLQDNFPPHVFDQLKKNFTIKDGFMVEEINNPNMMKPG